METKTKQLKKILLNWYKNNKRSFSWRDTNDPWKILLIEIISQQTQINRANTYYQKFIKKFPTPESMSKSSLKTILKMWSGLGYNIRAKRIYESSKILAKKGFEGIYPNFELLRHDIVDPFKVEVDWIFNLACPASPVHYQYNPIKTTKTNVLGTLNMLGLAKRLNARILQASTSEVYGDPLVTPQTEEYWGNVNPNGERSMYDEAKRFAEAATATYARTYDIKTKIVRIFNTYGPRMQLNDGRVVTNLIVQALNNEDITIYGDGSQTRSFSYVDDTVAGILALMKSDNCLLYTSPSPRDRG